MYDFPNLSTSSNTDLVYTLYNDSGSTINSITASWKEIGIWEAGPITGANTGTVIFVGAILQTGYGYGMPAVRGFAGKYWKTDQQVR